MTYFQALRLRAWTYWQAIVDFLARAKAWLASWLPSSKQNKAPAIDVTVATLEPANDLHPYAAEIKPRPWYLQIVDLFGSPWAAAFVLFLVATTALSVWVATATSYGDELASAKTAHDVASATNAALADRNGALTAKIDSLESELATTKYHLAELKAKKAPEPETTTKVVYRTAKAKKAACPAGCAFGWRIN